MYRNQTNNMNIIQAMAAMRITTPQEAVAFLRAEQNIHTQIAGVLQRVSLGAQQRINRSLATNIPVQQPEPASTPVEPEKKFEPENLSSDEGFSEEEIEKRVSQLKGAKAVKTSKKK